MKKRKNLGKKLVTMLVSVGFFAVLITALNLMALQAIREKNNVLIDRKSTRLNSSHNRESRMPSSA